MTGQPDFANLLAYEPLTGEFRWLKDVSVRMRRGMKAGFLHALGYVHIRIKGHDYKAHRIAWCLTHGRMPPHHIDHINGIKNDNRLCNLREATNAENLQNEQRARVNSKTGVLGVSFKKRIRRFAAQITVDGATKHLGYFDSVPAASSAYLTAKAAFHPFQTIASKK